MSSYYSRKLSAERLKQVYDFATPRIKQYLESELTHVLEKIRPGDLVLELGCGYGRIVTPLAAKAKWVAAIDVSGSSLRFAAASLGSISNISLCRMDAANLGFRDYSVDCVVCIQNGISAFRVDPQVLISESVRVTRREGHILFSSYSKKFWKERLEWFELQSRAGLVGEIDYEATKDGVIVCKDGFTATTLGPEDFSRLTEGFDVSVEIEEIDESSLFCEIVRK